MTWKELKLIVKAARISDESEIKIGVDFRTDDIAGIEKSLDTGVFIIHN